MAAEYRRPPRIARSTTNMQDASAALRAAATGDGAGPLLAFEINGTRPFGPTALDAAEMLIEQVAHLATVLGAGHEEADAAQSGGATTDAITDLRGSVHAGAFGAIGSLSALAGFFLDQHRGA